MQTLGIGDSVPVLPCNWVLNEAAAFKSSSIMVYKNTEQSNDTQMVWHDAASKLKC